MAVPADGGAALLACGDVDRPVFARSAVKPLQALPLFTEGLVARAELTAEECAVLCASHDGTPVHTTAVRRVLAAFGLDEALLRCGPHAPFDKKSSLAIARAGEKPARIHNNCSGKHAGFLALARHCGDPLERYLEPDSAAQRQVRAAVAGAAGLESGALEVGADGCGAPTLRLPLIALARAFARLANHPDPSSVEGRACAAILQAVHRAPVLVAGERRLCTALLRAAPVPMFAKNGAEGVYAVGVSGTVEHPGFGLAVKVDDGHERGYMPAVVHALVRLGVWRTVPDALQRFAEVPVLDTNKQPVGSVRCAVEW